MVVDPLAPGLEVVGAALVSDALERPDANPVVERDAHGAFLPSLGMCVLQDGMVATCPVVTVAERLEDTHDLVAREIA